MTIRLASAPVSWGIYEFEDMMPMFAYTRVLDEMHAAGYAGTELGPYGYLPTNPQVLRAELDARGLRLLSAFVPVNLADASAHAAGIDEALKVGKLLHALGADTLVLADDNGAVPDLVARAGRRTDSVLTSDQWDVYARGVNAIASRVHDAYGLRVAFHHHCGGYVETPDETRMLLDRTDPAQVGLCLDTGHWQYAGGDALDAVREFGDRITYLHLKDHNPTVAARCSEANSDYFQAVMAGVFCPLGEGDVDFPGVIGAMRANLYDGWAIVEQDILTDDLDAPKRYATANRAYLLRIGL
ncbi:MAG: TIM barrel protein [Chloroflexota bacterium]|nr:TIM barrel protein [Chloroflexota bacterium]